MEHSEPSAGYFCAGAGEVRLAANECIENWPESYVLRNEMKTLPSSIRATHERDLSCRWEKVVYGYCL